MAKKNGKSKFEGLDEVTQAKMSGLLSAYVLGIIPELYAKAYEAIASNPKTSEWLMNPWSFEQLTNDTGLLNLDYIDEHFDGLASKCLQMIKEDEEALLPIDIFEQIASAFRDMKKNDVEFKVPRKLRNASKKTLRLKIKIKNIVKPPVWREIEISADSDFYDLHDTIQIVFGWSDYHLWQFIEKEYDYPFAIRIETPDEDLYDFQETRVSPETSISSFLQKEGDKILYQYDYGDDWIHEISVVEVIDKKCDYPQLLKAKGDMMIEDIGGAHMYMMVRDHYLNIHEKGEEEMSEFLENFLGGMSVDEFIEMMKSTKTDIDEVNEELKEEFDISDLI